MSKKTSNKYSKTAFLKVSFILSIFSTINFTLFSAIIGQDQRVPSTSQKYPFSAIGKIRFIQKGKSSFCTAPLISAQIAVTNAHCLQGEKSSFSVGGKNIKIKRIWVSKSYQAGAKLHDLGFIILTKPVGNKIGWFELRSYDHFQIENKAIFNLSGYSQDLDFYTLKKKCKAKHQVRSYVFSHDCDTNFGSSGAPLFITHKSLKRAILLGINAKTSSPQKCEKFSPTCQNYAVNSAAILSELRKIDK